MNPEAGMGDIATPRLVGNLKVTVSWFCRSLQGVLLLEMRINCGIDCFKQ